MSFWDSIKYILGGLTLIVVAVVGLVLAVMPIIYRCKDLLQGNTAKMRAKDKLLLTKFGSIGSIIYVVFDALLAGFFTFLPLYVMGVAWQLSALFAIGTLACKSGMSSDTEREFYLYVVGGGCSSSYGS